MIDGERIRLVEEEASRRKWLAEVERLRALHDDESTDPVAVILGLERERDKLRGLLRPFAKFALAWSQRPLSGIADTVYQIHVGTEWEAGLRLSDCEAARAALGEEVEGVLLTACSVRGDTVHARRPDSRDAVCGVPNINVADDPFDRTSAWSCKRCLAALGEEVDRG